MEDNQQFTHLFVSKNCDIFSYVTSMYGSPSPVERRNLWGALLWLFVPGNEGWFLMGDFNVMLSDAGKRGGRNIRGACCFFQEFVKDANLIDFVFLGSKFTWRRGLLRKQLNRALGSDAWIQKFPNTTIQHLARVGSDISA